MGALQLLRSILSTNGFFGKLEERARARFGLLVWDLTTLMLPKKKKRAIRWTCSRLGFVCLSCDSEYSIRPVEEVVL